MRDKEIFYIFKLYGVFNMVVPYPFSSKAGEEGTTVERKAEVAGKAANICSLATNHMKVILW